MAKPAHTLTGTDMAPFLTQFERKRAANVQSQAVADGTTKVAGAPGVTTFDVTYVLDALGVVRTILDDHSGGDPIAMTYKPDGVGATSPTNKETTANVVVGEVTLDKFDVDNPLGTVSTTLTASGTITDAVA